MEEPYTEGLASHGGPESCVGRRKAGGEALTGVRTGWVWSHEIHSGVPTPFADAEGNTGGRDSASDRPTLRGRRPHACAEPSCARTGRSSSGPWQMALRAASGRPRP
jgi:hypothetical protein